MLQVKQVLKVMVNLCQQQLWKEENQKLWVIKDHLQDQIIKMNLMVGVIFGVKKNVQMENIEHIEKDLKKKINQKQNHKVLHLVKVK